MPAGDEKAQGALKTISEVSRQFGIPQHILRYWETRFPQLRPLQRAGNRRYYRSTDVALVGRIDTLLNREGYTIKGVQKLLSQRGSGKTELPRAPEPSRIERPMPPAMLSDLKALRSRLAAAISEDRA